MIHILIILYNFNIFFIKTAIQKTLIHKMSFTKTNYEYNDINLILTNAYS